MRLGVCPNWHGSHLDVSDDYFSFFCVFVGAWIRNERLLCENVKFIPKNLGFLSVSPLFECKQFKLRKIYLNIIFPESCKSICIVRVYCTMF